MPSVGVAHQTGGRLLDLVAIPEWVEFVPSQLVTLDLTKYAELLNRVEETLVSGTNKEKGDALEELAEFLLNSIRAFKVEAKTNTATGELDRVLTVSTIPGTFLQQWSSYVPLECKNWNEAVGPGEVDRLYRKACNMRANRGILFSSKGVTGRVGQDGWGEICNLFSQEGYITIVITLEDLQRIKEGICPLKIIENRQRELHLSI